MTDDDQVRDADAPAARVPSADEFLAIDQTSWRWLVRVARRVLNELPPTVEDPRLARLRAAPAKKLVEGRARRDLAGLLAIGGAPWLGVLAALREADDRPAALSWLSDGTSPPEAGTSTVDTAKLEREIRQLQERMDRAGEETSRLRERVQVRQRERDEARAALDGAQGRLASAERDLAATTAELATVRAELGRAREEAAGADERTQAAVARERRRHEARIRDLEDEVSALRRAEQDRRDAEAAQARRERAEEAAKHRAVEAAREEQRVETQQTRSRRRRGPLARSGRPSSVPEQIVPGSKEHASALLTPDHWLYVDGYNVTKTVRPDLPDEAAERAWLLPRVARLAASTGVPTTVFWDGQAAAEQRVDSAVVQRFSADSDKADDDIVFEVSLAPEDQPVVVVTDDRELRGRLSAHHVDLLHARAFGWLLGA